MAIENLVGNAYGRLVVKGFDHKNHQNKVYWICQCECGKQKSVRSDQLKSGRIKSCGCLKKEQNKLNLGKIKHGYARRGKIAVECKIWSNMLKRCGNKDDPDYGGRGIKVCEHWRKFENFIEDMGCRPSPEHTIERKDNNGNYCTENCVWATRQEQSLNKRNNINLTVNGETKNLSEWAKICNLSYKSLNHHYKRKPLSEVLSIIQENLNEKGL